MDTAIEKKSRNQSIIPDSALTQELASQMAITTRATRSTKRTAARIAIMNVIQANILQPGDLLPSEKELTHIMGVSLGTVQAALKGLQEIGMIVRRRGDGTRVAKVEPFGEDIWHFRFLSKTDGTPLRFIDQEPWIDLISTHGIWSEYLGYCEEYVRIRRTLTLQDKIPVAAEMYLDTSAAKGLNQIDARELTHTNIRPYLEQTYGLSTKGASHIIQTVKLDNEIAKIFDLPPNREYFEIQAKAHSSDNRPIYFQRIYVSTRDCAMMF